MAFYGGYYLINPSTQGDEILDNLNIPHPTIIAHRGDSSNAPESTKSAFLRAAKMGVDYLEADIHRTKDGKLVVFHDSNLKRTTNVEEIYPNRKNNHISTFTYDELLKLDCGIWFNKRYPYRADDEYIGLKIITLEQLLEIADQYDRKSGVVLDIKDGTKYPGIETDIMKLLSKKGWYQKEKEGFNKIKSEDKADILIFSFDLYLLSRFKKIAPEIPSVLLLNNNRISRRNWNRWLKLAEGTADGIGVKRFISWPWNIALAHEKGMFVFPYVINKGWQLELMAHIKSNGYITDRPEFILQFFDRFSDFSIVEDD